MNGEQLRQVCRFLSSKVSELMAWEWNSKGRKTVEDIQNKDRLAVV